MSLTRFLDNKESRAKFKAAFQKPRIDLSNFKLVAPPLTTNYGLVGCAFDYLVRFYLQRTNPSAIVHPWFVEKSLGLGGKKAEKVISEAKVHVSKYLKNGLITDELLISCLKLSALEGFYRSGISEVFDKFKVDENDVKDLKSMLESIDSNAFQAKQYIELNPSFGQASRSIGGADADLIIDNMIVDLKCTKNLEVDRDDFNQIVGYYVLNEIERLSKSKRPKIQKIALYFVRFKALISYDIDDILIDNTLDDFYKWFKKTALKL